MHVIQKDYERISMYQVHVERCFNEGKGSIITNEFRWAKDDINYTLLTIHKCLRIWYTLHTARHMKWYPHLPIHYPSQHKIPQSTSEISPFLLQNGLPITSNLSYFSHRIQLSQYVKVKPATRLIDTFLPCFSNFIMLRKWI